MLMPDAANERRFNAAVVADAPAQVLALTFMILFEARSNA
jgi:hypothetical protein